MTIEIPPADQQVIAAPRSTPRRFSYGWEILLFIVLLVGAYFRLVGLDWGENQYLHPDERFLIWVGTDITPIKQEVPKPDGTGTTKVWISLKDYFDTQNSPLNPVNRGHSFYVYGTLPMFITRFLVEGFYGHSGFDEMTRMGRVLSALADLLTVLFVYLVAKELFDKRVGVLAALFSALAVLQIQQSHFFTMDTFINFFTLLALYFAVRVLVVNGAPLFQKGAVAKDTNGQGSEPAAVGTRRYGFFRDPLFLLSLGFGIALGCAVASKLNAAPVALALPLAMLLRVLRASSKDREKQATRASAYLLLAAFLSLMVFRLFQPYAFSGPGFFDLKPDPRWLANIKELFAGVSADVDYPFALQWARRPVWFSGKNLVLWGLGLPLGALAWAGFLWVGWRILKGEWYRHFLLWGWTALYFIWQSLAFNPTMRYQLPVYPTLVIFAGWAIIALYDRGKSVLPYPLTNHEEATGETLFSTRRGRWWKISAITIGSLVILGTLAWAYAFTRIYTRPITRVEASRWIYQNIPGPINLHIQTGTDIYNQPVYYPVGSEIRLGQPFSASFSANADGVLNEIYLANVVDQAGIQGNKLLTVDITTSDSASPMAVASIESEFQSDPNPENQSYLIKFTQPVSLSKNNDYRLTITLQTENAAISMQGMGIANESDYDDGLPLRQDGYDAIYPPDLVFQSYWDENPEKLARYLDVMKKSEYIVITSNRQWGSIPRVPERYPMTTIYYRELLGCPSERTIEWCYNNAEVGFFQGKLGYELVRIFQSDPSIGPLQINDQWAEEAFTVYDHPKVFIFHKTTSFDLEQVRQVLGAVDFSHVVHLTPKKAKQLPQSDPGELMLPADRLVEQQQGGTWSDYFNPQALQNRIQPLGVLLWYLAIGLLGLLVYPILRFAMPGLPDHGYPLARTAGLLLLSYLVWLGGSFRIPVTRVTISLVLLLIALVGVVLAYIQRDGLREEWRERRKYFLIIEGLFLAFFLFDLFIRLGNPDLWHPWKGGERPMDFSYFNAILKSTSYPPYDPWYAGGYLNYYYYGLYMVGVMVKWLGIVPSFAHNLILPTVFSLIAMGAFSIGWNLFTKRDNGFHPPQLIAGISSALGMAVLGNLGTVRMIFQGYERLAAPEGVIEGANLITRWVWAFRGAAMSLSGQSLPYALADWYWNPSRVMPPPDDAITEFPFFTTLYSDPHAHLYAMAVALLAMTWVISLILGRARWKNIMSSLVSFLIGGLAIGALNPINLSDTYTYLLLGVIAAVYAFWRYYDVVRGKFLSSLPAISKRLVLAVGSAILIVVLSRLLFAPYTQWYGQAYGSFKLLEGPRTPTSSYLTHWGLFLFVFITWMMYESRDWMAKTPLSALHKLQPYRELILAAIVLFLGGTAIVTLTGVHVAWLVLPLAAWAGILLLRPGLPDAKRIVLFLIGSGLVITLVVDIIEVRGAGRMNTVFKFYLQAWTLFAISAGAAVGWLVSSLSEWKPGWRLAWQIPFGVLVVSAALYTLLGGMAKIKDRWEPNAPHTLDGMAYMQYVTYDESEQKMDLSQDYAAIRWMQDNIQGSPVIVEANSGDYYRWFSRITVYTGLPGVVGWAWHQQQERALLPSEWVSIRLADINDFYTTTRPGEAEAFLQKYNVSYIVFGQLEKYHYPGPGLEKFPALEGVLWKLVYQEKDTIIYEVIK